MKAFISEKTMLLLTLFAVLTIVFVMASLFTSFTEPDLTLNSSSSVKLGTPEFRATLESITRSPAQSLDSEIKLIGDGSVFLEDLLGEMEKAQSSITITNYIFKEGEMTNSVFDLLTKKAREGVEVRLILDAYGGKDAPEEKLAELKKAGGVITTFRPVSFRSLTRAHRRTHIRAIVIDGQIAYAGGLAFDDTWLGDGTNKENWRDTMFKFESHMARATQDQFNSLWRQTNGEILTGQKFYPELVDEREAGSDSYFISLFHAPAPDISSDLLNIIWLSITGADSHIYLSTPYLTPPPEILAALKEAVKRGVKVEVLVPGSHTDSKIVQSATRSYYETLLEAGVRIYEYQPGRFHEKALVVDGHWSLIGSANMDNRSAALNVENIFGIDDPGFAQILEERFESNKALSGEIEKDKWNPNIFKQAYYRFVSLFVKQF